MDGYVPTDEERLAAFLLVRTLAAMSFITLLFPSFQQTDTPTTYLSSGTRRFSSFLHNILPGNTRLSSTRVLFSPVIFVEVRGRRDEVS
ncbi:hypothetical protein CONLIGDRAFT_628647 [Coniochaeta ligniaria NRRL 30616]|uniref:Uncharacterized protein n=1 Tax=Coniochaeta ligniaria NRRL 30616 TaxID=1408157 RepID=A0A1J7JK31_9PEZI|nr:hypothetical protein CONLIGDRAFT_628647 [Coniochaeta ligniaria NRRL 30616]